MRQNSFYNYTMDQTTYRKQFPTVGPAMIADLALIGITSREQLIDIWSVAAMDRSLAISWWQKGRTCSCQTYAFEWIIRWVARHKIPYDVKQLLKIATHKLRENINSLGLIRWCIIF